MNELSLFVFSLSSEPFSIAPNEVTYRVVSSHTYTQRSEIEQASKKSSVYTNSYKVNILCVDKALSFC